jgi:hypothetical protein
MAFESKNLAVLAYANGFTLWHYQTADAAAGVDSAGYFNGAAQMLRVGDIIERTTFDDGTFAAVSTYGRHIVLSNNGTTVDVSDTTAGTVTDTD